MAVSVEGIAMKDWLFPQHDALRCPHCGGGLACRYPHYTVRERYLDLHFKEQRALLAWVVVIALGVAWWPLLFVASNGLIWLNVRRARQAPLYVCASCNQILSYDQADGRR